MQEDNTPIMAEQFAQLKQTSPQIEEDFSEVDYIYNDVVHKAQTNLEKYKKEGQYRGAISNLFSKPKKRSFSEDRININDAYTKLSDGTFITRYDEGYMLGADNEQRYAENQTTGSKWANGLGKFVGKTLVNTAGGFLGTAYGLVDAVANGNFDKIMSNDFYDMLDDYNAKMDNFAANYRTQEERNMGFGSSMGTANFWADDFLGGMSFMVGTVMSEALWAAATGGTSLSTTASRVALRAATALGGASKIAKGSKVATKGMKKLASMAKLDDAVDAATTWGKIGEVANTARFTYTSAGFESGMEARLYENEQRELFFRDFEDLNGRKPTNTEVAEFENNLDNTKNALFVANMALVGASNLAVFGKTFNIKSPLDMPSKTLNAKILGKGVKTTYQKGGEALKTQRLNTEAIKRNTAQKVMGFSYNLLKNPVMEGVVEEGGQATFSTAMENYVTSRYNPSKDAMGIVESMYDAMAHTYGTKEGWKEVGLGMLIGFVGGEASSKGASIAAAKNSLNDQDGQEIKDKKTGEVIGYTGSIGKAKAMNKNRGENIVNKQFAVQNPHQVLFEERLSNATEIQLAQEQYDKAESEGSLHGMANAQDNITLTSVKNAVDYDFLEEQIEDYRLALNTKTDKEIAETFGIEESEAKSKRDELLADYKATAEMYQKAKTFTEYIVSDNPKELFEDATDIDVNMVRSAIAHQMVISQKMEKNSDAVATRMIKELGAISPTLKESYQQAIEEYKIIQKTRREDIANRRKLEKTKSQKQEELNKLLKELEKLDSPKIEGQDKKNEASRVNKINNRIPQLENEIAELTNSITEAKKQQGNLSKEYTDTFLTGAAVNRLQAELEAADPLATTDGYVAEDTLDDTISKLEELEERLTNYRRTHPQEVTTIERLAQDYKRSLEVWKRNAQTLEDLANPEVGLTRIGTMFQKKKQASVPTLEMLKRLQQTKDESDESYAAIENLMNPIDDENTPPATGENEQTRVTKEDGDDPTQTPPLTNEEVSEKKTLLDQLKELIKNNAFLINFSKDDNLLLDEKPTSEEIDEYNRLRNKDFKAGDIRKLMGRPIDQISQKDKDRSGLSDEQILRLQELSTKLTNWRIVSGTNDGGYSIEEILQRIDALNAQIESNPEAPTAEQTLEYTSEAERQFEGETIYTDLAQSPDTVVDTVGDTHTQISHMEISDIVDMGGVIQQEEEIEVGTTEESRKAVEYTIELPNDKGTIKIQKLQANGRLIIKNEDVLPFYESMQIQRLNYKRSTFWNYVFQKGKAMATKFGIKLINSQDATTMSIESIYNLKGGDKVNFSISLADRYNIEKVIPLIEQGKIEEAESKIAIYTTNEEGQVFGWLQAHNGKVSEDKENFLKLRKAAVQALKNRLENGFTVADLSANQSENVIKLPFETTVNENKPFFVGTANLEIDENGKAKVFKLKEEHFTRDNNKIVEFGYAEENAFDNRKDVRRAFVANRKGTPYVVIQVGNTKIAYPVGMGMSNISLEGEFNNILQDDNLTPQSKVNQIILFLKENGIDPTKPGLEIGIEEELTEQQITNIREELKNTNKRITKEDVKNMTQEEFIAAAEITLDMEQNRLFLSPKVNMDLSSNLKDLNTNETTTSAKVPLDNLQNFMFKYREQLAAATTKKEVRDIVYATQDQEFKTAFNRNKQFQKAVESFALTNNRVPTIVLNEHMEELILDLIDDNNDSIPLDLVEDLANEVAMVKRNPSEKNIKELADKILPLLRDRYKIAPKGLDTQGLYHIPTMQSEQQMLDKGFIRVQGDFYKKIQNKYTVEQLQEGLYKRYKEGMAPEHLNLEEGLTREQFNSIMGSTLLDIYKRHYNTTERQIPNGTQEGVQLAIFTEQEYLKKEFKGDFAEFINKHRNNNTDLYNNLLKHFEIAEKGILKEDFVNMEMLDKYKEDLGKFYNDLIDYSIISKHMDLEVTPQRVTFAFLEDSSDLDRMVAANSNTLPKAKKPELALDGTLLARNSEEFIEYNNNVYQSSYKDGDGNNIYEKIADRDNEFLVTTITRPTFNGDVKHGTRPDTTKANVKKDNSKEDPVKDC